MSGAALKDTLRRFVPAGLRPSAFVRRHVSLRTGDTVMSGPFEGMKFVDRAVWGAYVPKLLGSYEKEVHFALEEARERGARFVIDIGGAEGYYAVGLLRFLPNSRVTVFEMLAEGRRLIDELATLNDVRDRLYVAGTCTVPALDELLGDYGGTAPPFIICDIEGFEKKLLDPDRVRGLNRSLLLVEVHDHKCDGASDTLVSRFESTHDIVRIEQEERTQDDFPLQSPLAFLPTVTKRYALNEFRNPQTAWLWMTPRDER